MERVLLQLQKKKDRRRLEDWLGKNYQIVLPHPEAPLEGELDLVLIDGPSLNQLRPQVEEKRKEQAPVFLPFLLLTVRRRGSVPSRHLGRLVDDLIVRPLHQKEVQARVANLLRMRRWSVDLQKEHDRAMKLAVTDDVSGFFNTRYLHRYLDRLIDTAGAKPTELCLVFFDLDNFKHLVDAHGHLLGSKVLKEVAQTVQRVLGEDDRIVRYGGDEFIVILPRQCKQEALAKVGRMRNAILGTTFLQKEQIDAHLTASFGLACYPHDASDKRQLLIAADRCLFRSKTQGKDQITCADIQIAA
jgi:diguanylate cyclase (GGDEF)-like protein